MFGKKKSTSPAKQPIAQQPHVLVQHDNQGDYVVTTFFITEALVSDDRNAVLDELSDIDEIVLLDNIVLSRNYVRVRWETPDERDVFADDIRRQIEEEMLDALTRIFDWHQPVVRTVSPHLDMTRLQPGNVDWRLDHISS